MELSKAIEIANKVVEKLKPFTERIEIAGSIRRLKSDVGDIEIVAIPKKDRSGLINIVSKWQKVRGEPTGKYTQRVLPDGIKLDLFFATKDNWGLIFAIRTGSAEYSHKVLATNWVKLGYKSIEGMLHKDGKPIEIREEIDLFNLLKMDYVKPELRFL